MVHVEGVCIKEAMFATTSIETAPRQATLSLPPPHSFQTANRFPGN